MLQLNFKKFETIQLHGIAENPTRRSKSPNKKHKKFRTKNDKINKQKARRISKTRDVFIDPVDSVVAVPRDISLKSQTIRPAARFNFAAFPKFLFQSSINRTNRRNSDGQSLPIQEFFRLCKYSFLFRLVCFCVPQSNLSYIV